jgi:hypothetical protein
MFGKIEPKHLMIKIQIVVHNHQLVQVTSIQGLHIQQNGLRIEDGGHDD